MATHSSILENPHEQRCLAATVRGVTKSRTRLSNYAQHSIYIYTFLFCCTCCTCDHSSMTRDGTCIKGVLTTGLQAKSSPVILNLIRNDKGSKLCSPKPDPIFLSEKKILPSLQLSWAKYNFQKFKNSSSIHRIDMCQRFIQIINKRITKMVMLI